jgi:hypothetical protein
VLDQHQQANHAHGMADGVYGRTGFTKAAAHFKAHDGKHKPYTGQLHA